VLLQERFTKEPWKMLVICILLNKTERHQVEKIFPELFRKYPTPKEMADADESLLSNFIRSLGLGRKRARTLIKFSQEWLTVPWDHPGELYGIGKYAADSYSIFYLHRRDVRPEDNELINYLKEKQ